MNVDELLSILYPDGKADLDKDKKKLTPDQINIVKHPNGPAWVLAGPGSGKTEVLTILVLRLLYVENDEIQSARVPPESIIITTFTDKASRNLQDRISRYRSIIVSSYPELGNIDISKLRIGTLHGLCNDILQEYRSTNYQNVRLMDKFEQTLFIHQYMNIINRMDVSEKLKFWREFGWMFAAREWKPTYDYLPNKWLCTKKLMLLLDRVVENRISIEKLNSSDQHLVSLAKFYLEYMDHLKSNYRCDFSHLQLRFLEFLRTPLGIAFLQGDSSGNNRGIQWVLVDEYQDTNPIQEEIYFELTKHFDHNLVVVGDDDQAMYRFRGGSVECMITFDDACRYFLGIPKTEIKSYPLVDNFRSHPKIVDYFNEYISGFPIMQKQGVRSPKPSIRPKKNIQDEYPVLTMLRGKTFDETAEKFAKMVRELVDNEIVSDPSDCCLLLKSTKESPNNAGKYVKALLDKGFLVYNPRNKAYAEQEEVRSLLGTMMACVDPYRRIAGDPYNIEYGIIPEKEPEIRFDLQEVMSEFPKLSDYVNSFTQCLTQYPGKSLDLNLQELAYNVMSFEPFNGWQKDSIKRIRLGKITRLLEAYSSMPILDYETGKVREYVTRGYMKTSEENRGEINEDWVKNFYNLFVGFILNAGFDDEEDDEEIVPPGMVPVMTMHQSKGLEFPFVFVGNLGENPKISVSHELESLFSDFTINDIRSLSKMSALERAETDLIRQYYVAYSRAKYALVLLSSNTQISRQSTPLGPIKYWARERTTLL